MKQNPERRRSQRGNQRAEVVGWGCAEKQMGRRRRGWMHGKRGGGVSGRVCQELVSKVGLH